MINIVPCVARRTRDWGWRSENRNVPFFSIAVQGDIYRYYFLKRTCCLGSQAWWFVHTVQLSRDWGRRITIVWGHLGSTVNIRLSLTRTATIVWDSALQNTEGEVKGGRRRENVETERNAAWVCSCLKGCSPGQEAAPALECSSKKWVSVQQRPLYGKTLSGEVGKDEKDQQFFTRRRKTTTTKKTSTSLTEKQTTSIMWGHFSTIELATWWGWKLKHVGG